MHAISRVRKFVGSTLAVSVLASLAFAHGPYSPPRQVYTETIGDEVYAKCDVYLSCHADTSALHPLGFRNLQFNGWCLSRVRYEALCPLSWDGIALPSCVSGISYQTPDLPYSFTYADDYSGDGSPSVPIRYHSSSRDNSGYWSGLGSSPFGCSTRHG